MLVPTYLQCRVHKLIKHRLLKFIVSFIIKRRTHSIRQRRGEGCLKNHGHKAREGILWRINKQNTARQMNAVLQWRVGKGRRVGVGGEKGVRGRAKYKGVSSVNCLVNFNPCGKFCPSAAALSHFRTFIALTPGSVRLARYFFLCLRSVSDFKAFYAMVRRCCVVCKTTFVDRKSDCV